MRSRAHVARWAATAGAAALVLTACGTGEATTSAADSAASGSPSARATDPAGSGSAAVDHPLTFQSVTTDGAEFDAADLAGQDVVLWFWAPWCTICRSEAPQVADVAEEMDGTVQLVGVASSGSLEQMQAFVTDTGTESITHVADVQGDVWRQFGVVAQPTFVFVDDDGRTQTFAGALGHAALLDAMKQLADA
jgi:thiol-disulfide isomerase/thioredoxin